MQVLFLVLVLLGSLLNLVQAEELHAATTACPMNFQSSLPLLHIDTRNKGLSRTERVKGKLVMVEPQGHGLVSSCVIFKPEWSNVGRDIEVRWRGNSSLDYPKKNYQVTFPHKDSLLGMGKGEDFALHGPYVDRSLIHNALTFTLASYMGGWYVPKVRLVELFLNREYKGLYVAMEKIEAGKERLNIPKYNLQRPESSSFIAKVDGWNDMPNFYKSTFGTPITYVYPKLTTLKKKMEARELTMADVDRFKEAFSSRIKQFERTLMGEDWNAIQSLIDEQSFVNFIIIQEVTKNFDGFRRSIFFHDKGDGIIHLGPIWDFDLSFANVWFHRTMNTSGWLLGSLFRPPLPHKVWNRECMWFRRLLGHSAFAKKVILTYKILRRPGYILHWDNVNHLIDSMVFKMGSAAERNFSVWPVLGRPSRRFWLTSPPWPRTHAGEIDKLKGWLKARLEWMDANIDSIQH